MNAQPVPATRAVDPILQQLTQRLGAAQGAQAQVFASHFFKRVSDEDIAARSPDSWTAVVAGPVRLHPRAQARHAARAGVQSDAGA